MSKKIFNPSEWQTSTTPQPTAPRYTVSNSPNSDIEEITKRIESTATDIAPNYADWRDLGFALADGLGEGGRDYFHRLSHFYSGYSPTETDKQYTACLASHGHGVTLKTFYHLAKQAGVSVAIAPPPSAKKESQISTLPNCQNGNMDKWQNDKTSRAEAKSHLDYAEGCSHFVEQNESVEQEEKKLPTFPAEIFSQLPEFLQRITDLSISPEDADLLLLGSLTVISACLPKAFGIYGGITVYPNQFLFVAAQASAGKGRLSLCRRLVEPIHRQLRELNKLEYEDYKRKQTEYAANKKNPDAVQPEEPPLRMLFVPANSSATAVFQILHENEGVGLMFETEGDTLAQTFKSEHGNYSDGFRKAFHHEKISYLRRKDREYVTLEEPKLSALLSGTPRQIQSLIPDAENGLFSRFVFYYMNLRLEWLDVFSTHKSGESLDKIFDDFGLQFFEFYQNLKTVAEIRFALTTQQQGQFNKYFEQTQLQYYELCGKDYIGTVRRLGLITYRFALILTVLRIMQNGTYSSPLVCSDTDFNTAMEMVKVLIQHAAHVFSLLSPQVNENQANPKTMLLHSLPEQFDRAKYIEVAKQLNIPESTADKQIARFCKADLLTKESHGCYVKKK